FRGQFARQQSPTAHVRFGSKADIVQHGGNVRFVPKADFMHRSKTASYSITTSASTSSLLPSTERFGGLQIDGELRTSGEPHDRQPEAKRAGFGDRFCFRHQAGFLAGPAMARINRATCSGSSSGRSVSRAGGSAPLLDACCIRTFASP